MYRVIKAFVMLSSTALAFASCSESDPKPVEKEIVAHVETFAGGSEGFEDGPLLNAKFKWPSQIVGSPSGSFYVLDQNGTAVRKISADGMVSTLYSDVSNTLNCIAVDEDEKLYVSYGPFILEVINGGTEVMANGLDYFDERYFHTVWSMQFHPDGNLYGTESSNARIMKISKAGEVSLFAGGQQGYVDGNLADAKFSNRQGILIASNGDIYLADFNNYKFRKISEGKVTTIAGTTHGNRDGPALEAAFGNPFYMARTKDGTIYLTGTEHNIRKISPDGNVSTVAGVEPGFRDSKGRSALFFAPAGLALDHDENLYVADYHNHRIRKIVFKLE